MHLTHAHTTHMYEELDAAAAALVITHKVNAPMYFVLKFNIQWGTMVTQASAPWVQYT